MPASYEIDPDRSVIRVAYSGPLTSGDVVGIMEALAQDPRVRPGMGMLSDHSLGTTFATPGLVVGVMPSFERLALQLGGLRVAMVTPHAAQVGMVNLAAVHARGRGIEFKPFPSRQEAEAWLDESR